MAPGRRIERGALQARSLYYRHVAPFRRVERRTGAAAVALDEWVASLGSPSHVVVVGAGPTAADLRPRAADLHVSTNSSDRVVAGHPYVHFLAEGYPVARHLKSGPRSPTCRGTFFRLETGDRPEAQAEVARRVLAYSRTYRRASPDVVASDLEEGTVERANYDLFESRTRAWLGVPVRQFNSGFGATYLGYFLAATLEVPLELYGLDAGVGGQRHFDGSTMSSPSVVGERVRRKLADLHAALAAQDRVPVTNHSAFRPDGTGLAGGDAGPVPPG